MRAAVAKQIDTAYEQLIAEWDSRADKIADEFDAQECRIRDIKEKRARRAWRENCSQ